MCPYDKLSDLYKGIIQIVIGMTTVLYVLGIFPYWIPFLASLALIAHGCVHTGLYDIVTQMVKKNNRPKRM